jgi:hypothetical protein
MRRSLGRQFGVALGGVRGRRGRHLARGQLLAVSVVVGAASYLLVTGTLRACWSFWLAFIRPGAAGIVLVVVVQLGLVTSVGVFDPVYATYRLEQTGV